MCLLTELHKRLAARRRARAAAPGASGEAAVHTGRALACDRKTAGFTITEALATVIIVGLVTTILAGGIGLATSQYAKSIANSEAQMLYSSLQKIMDTELRFTKTILVPNGQEGEAIAVLTVKGFDSKHYRPASTGTGDQIPLLCTVPAGSDSAGAQEPASSGQLGMATEIASSGAVVSTFLGEGAYNYGLQARVSKLTYVKSGRYFVVDLAIVKSPDDIVLAQGTFTVHALNLTNAFNESGAEVDIEGVPTTPSGATGEWKNEPLPDNSGVEQLVTGEKNRGFGSLCDKGLA